MFTTHDRHLERTMTGYTVHTGTSKKFASGWDQIFGGQTEKSGKSARKKAGAKKKKASSSEPAAKKKKTARKQAARKRKK